MTLQLAQQILLDKFKTEPFHNLYLLNNVLPATTVYGGTCSDKTLSYWKAAKAAGLDVYLHSARINGQESHRLARVEIDNQSYFADIGNGWPSIQLFPSTAPIAYECYGMGYRTEIENGMITIYHLKRGIEKQQMVIDIACKPEAEILQGIAHRFSSNIAYPFSNQLRFSMVVGKRFLFIRDTQLEIYSGNGYEEIPNISIGDLPTLLMEYFDYDMEPLESHIMECDEIN